MTIRKQAFTALVSAARTATPATVSVDFGKGGVSTPQNENMVNMHIIIDVTAIVTTPSVVPVINAVDPLSGKSYALLTGVAITATGTTVLKVGRDIESAANVAAKDILPKDIELVLTHADADSITYSVSVLAEFECYQ